MSKKKDGVKQGFYDPFNPKNRPSTGTVDLEFMIMQELLELSLNRFEWTGLPEEVDVRWMEIQINSTGLAVFFKEKTDGMYRAMQGTPFGPINLIGQNTRYRVQGGMGWTRELGIAECVPIWCNYTRIPDLHKIQIYAKRIATMDRTIEINAKNARRSRVIRANERTRMSVENLNRLFDEGAPFIPIIDEADPASMLDAIDLGVNPQTIVDMHMLRTRQWQEALNHLGINTGNQDKKERLVAAESAANDDGVENIRRVNLNSRQQAAKAINKMFGLNVSVEFGTDETTAADQADAVDKAPALKAVNS